MASETEEERDGPQFLPQQVHLAMKTHHATCPNAAPKAGLLAAPDSECGSGL